MNDDKWMRWILQTARTWEDMSGVVRSIGIDVVDNDHKVFTEYVLELNVLIEALKDPGADMAPISREREIFEKVRDYTHVHFQHEEGIMREQELPGLKYHLKQHQLFAGVVQGYWDDFQAGRIHASNSLKLSILDWWVRHINYVDYNTFVTRSSFA